MQLNKLFKLGREGLELLEYYDKTQELLIGRKRIDITLDKKLIKKLREEAKIKRIPLSRLIENKIINKHKR